MTINAPPTERILHAPESGRFYRRTGEVVLEIPKARGEGVREPTIADARKYGFLYSVNEVLGILAKAGLDYWKREHLLRTAHTNPVAAGESLEEWVIRIDGLANEYVEATADRGTEIHKQIERHFAHGEECPDPVIQASAVAISQHYEGYIILPEVRFAAPDLGWAGTMDMQLLPQPGSGLPPRIADMKTRNLANWKKPTIENGLQLGGYARANYQDGLMLDTVAVDRETGEVQIFVWGEKWKRTQSMNVAELMDGFGAVFNACCVVCGYDPRIWREADEQDA